MPLSIALISDSASLFVSMKNKQQRAYPKFDYTAFADFRYGQYNPLYDLTVKSYIIHTFRRLRR